MHSFLEQPDTRVIAVCDVDANHLREAKEDVDRRYRNNDCAAYRDFRNLIARDDIDVVQITTPDHWHAPVAIAAAKAGKDMYGEKPFAHSLRDGRAACDAIKRYGRVWQTGSQMRSDTHIQFACELVLNGRIGKVHTVEVGMPGGRLDDLGEFEVHNGDKGATVRKPPKELDYDFWLGPAPYSPYVPARVHWNWRWSLDYDGGLLMDWIGHLVDITHWGLGMERTGPVEIDGIGEYLKDGLYDSAPRYRINTKYANGIEMVVAGGHDDIEGGVKWIGEDSWISTWDETDAHPKSLLSEKFIPNEISLRPPGSRGGHTRNFLDCVKSRATTIASSEVGHRSASVGHLGQISMLLARKIRFNPETEEIIGDATATRMLGNAMLSPWHL
jgi:predicted dehydrogenase